MNIIVILSRAIVYLGAVGIHSIQSYSQADQLHEAILVIYVEDAEQMRCLSAKNNPLYLVEIESKNEISVRSLKQLFSMSIETAG